MKLSLEWLEEYIDAGHDANELSHILTGAGLEVEGVDYRSLNVENVIVCRIDAIKPHPDSEKLILCNVSDGKENYSIVCGDPSLAVGDMVPLAKSGAILPGGMAIKTSKVRGEISEGMLCSEKELGLSEDGSGVMILPEASTMGEGIVSALQSLSPQISINTDGKPKKSSLSTGYSDSIFEIGLTPNRSDCLSVLGFARELSALTGSRVSKPSTALNESKRNVSEDISVEIEEPGLCSRYAARVIRGVKISKSPLWMRKRLESAGIRPINNVVDVTNYVMMELGQPMHAFDMDKIEGGKIIVRKSKKGESLITLDKEERSFSGDELLICDSAKPVAIAGVMGGLESSVDDHTVNILLESANFLPESVRKTARSHGLHTESSHRFERGVDQQGVLFALDRAAFLINSLAGGDVSAHVIDIFPSPLKDKEILFRPSRCSAILGLELSPKETVKILESLNMNIKGSGDAIIVTPPSYRVDIEREIDLIEEVARLKGYSNIPVEPLGGVIPESPSGCRTNYIPLLKRFMADCGYNEVVNYSFNSPGEDDRLILPQGHPMRNRVEIRNPISEDMSVLRTSLVGGLLNTAALNVNRQNRDLQLFEEGKVFSCMNGSSVENRRFAAIMTGTKEPLLWKRGKDIYDLKGILEKLLDLINVKNYTFINSSHVPYLHPGRTAAVRSGEREIAVIGEIHPSVTANYDINQRVWIFEADLDLIEEVRSGADSFRDIATFPFVERDIAFLINKNISLNDIVCAVEEQKNPLIEKIEVFDQFEGKGIEEGKKSIAIRLRYRDAEKTLTDERVNDEHQRIVRLAADKIGARIR